MLLALVSLQLSDEATIRPHNSPAVLYHIVGLFIRHHFVFDEVGKYKCDRP